MAKKASRSKPAAKPAKRPAPRAGKPAPKPSARAGKKPAARKPAARKPAVPRDGVTEAKAAALAPVAPRAVRRAKPAPERPDRARAFAIEAARSAADDKCDEVVLLDVRGIYQECDYVVIASGTSDRQIGSAGDSIEKLGPTLGYPLSRREVDDRHTWLLLDFVDVTVHLFEPNTRAYYDLELRWGDAKKVRWERPGQGG